MNLYLISQTVNHSPSAYRRAVIVAVDSHEASRVHPGGDFFNAGAWWEGEHHSGRAAIDRSGFWVKPERVLVELLGPAPGAKALPGASCLLPGSVLCAGMAEVGERIETFEARP